MSTYLTDLKDLAAKLLKIFPLSLKRNLHVLTSMQATEGHKGLCKIGGGEPVAHAPQQNVCTTETLKDPPSLS